MVRKIRMDKTQVLRCLRLRPFSPKETTPDVQTTSKQWRPDSEVITELFYLYARAWESDVGKPTSWKDQDEPCPSKASEVTLKSDNAIAETCSTLGSTRESSSPICPSTDRFCDRTGTDHHKAHIAEMRSEQPNSNPINPAVPNMIYVMTSSQTRRTNILNLASTLVCSTERKRTLS